MPPLVSVIIPNYNYGRYLGQAIDSVLAQSYRPVELLVIDDGSTDGSDEVVRRYGERVRWLRQGRGGVSAARNRGAQESRGGLLAFLDADDRWLPAKLERQVARWLAEPTLGLVHCGVELIDETGRHLSFGLDGVAGWVAKDLLLFRRATVVTGGSGALVTREAFEAVGGFDPRLSTSADWDFYYRIAMRQRFGFVPEALVQMRVHDCNMHADIRVMEHDMLLAFSKAFRDADQGIGRLRRRCYGNLHMVLAGSFFRDGQPLGFTRHALRSLWLTPGNVTRLLGFPVRCWRRRVDG